MTKNDNYLEMCEKERLGDLDGIVVLWWDHTLPFPDNRKTSCPKGNKRREEEWKEGPYRLAESLRECEEIRFKLTGKKSDVVIRKLFEC